MNADRCPCCGGPLAGVALAWLPESRRLVGCGHAVKFTPHEARLFDVLWRARGTSRFFFNPELVAHLYGHREDGGPVSAPSTVVVLFNRMRRKLARFGLTISRVGDGDYHGGGDAGRIYRLIAEVSP